MEGGEKSKSFDLDRRWFSDDFLISAELEFDGLLLDSSFPLLSLEEEETR
jgi:hypothetical protein